jgi:serine/threonine protein kinase/DNA-directed RNA polymerase subunit RPC12/RpoP
MLDYVDPADYPDRSVYEQAVDRARERFEDEGRILASLHHPGIPEIISYFTEQGRNYIVMEYVEGEDLLEGLTHVDGDGQLVAGGAYPVGDVVRWGIQVCKILEYLESRKPTPVIHHDIKPANLVVDRHTGDIRLVDFGTAQVRLGRPGEHGGDLPDASARLGQASIFGTIGYAPPEQYQGRSVPKSDVYALAATIYHLLTDDDPQQHPMSFPWPGSLDRPLTRALSRAVEPDLRKRSSAAQLRKALELWLQKPQTEAASPRSGDFRIVLDYVPDQLIEQTIESLQQELSMTETEATIKAYSAPITILATTSYAAAERSAMQLQAVGIAARLVEVDESYSRTLGPGAMRLQLVNRGQTRKLVATRLGKDRRCHCYECGHDWIAPKTRGRRPPLECPSCGSKRWSLRRVFKCRVCGNEFAHGDQESPARRLFPACPACGTIDWLSRKLPILHVRERELDLGTVRGGQSRVVSFSIANQGKGTLRGVVRCREPWLAVEKSFAGPGEISLPMDTGLLKRDGRYQGLIDILSNGGAHQLRVEFVAQMPEQLIVSPATLDFGRVDAQPVPQTVKATNAGGGLLRGTVTTTAPWLELSDGEISGNVLELQVAVRPAEMPQPDGAAALRAAIHLVTNGGDFTVPVQAIPSGPVLALAPQVLEFAAVAPGDRPSQAVQVANAGTGRLQGRIDAGPRWLRTNRSHWTGNSLELVVQVDGRRLPPEGESTAVVHLSSNGGDMNLDIRAGALGPTMVVEPSAVYLGAVRAGSRARTRLRVTNVGNGRLSGTARSTAHWLFVEPRRFSGNRISLSIWLRTGSLAPGHHAAAIEIETNGGRTSVGVQAQITAPRSLGGLFDRWR